MANSYVEYTTAGSGTNGLGQTTFTAPSKFLSINDIRAKGYNGSTWTELTVSSRGTTTVTLSATPTAGSYSKVRIYRATTSQQIIDFQAGARLAESDLDTAYNQGLYVAQEVSEDAGAVGTLVNNNQTLNGTTTVDNLTATGTVTIPSSTNLSVTNLTTTGIVQIPSGTDANHFYQEGTFTPVANDYSGTMNFEFAHYTKVGRMVNFAFKMTGDGTTDSSQIAISGFPFAVLAEHPVSLSSNAGDVFEGANAMVNTAEICYFYNKNGGAFTYTNLGSSYMRVQGTYMTA